MDFELIYKQLFAWCAARDFAGYDPFDGLSSQIFQSTPLKKSVLARLFLIQTIKRSPFNLRSILQVPTGVNAKGIALFALAEIARFRALQSVEHEENAKKLLGKLGSLSIRSPETLGSNSKTAFSYNFDWQSRAFFAPRGTPTIVPTAFAARAFIEAYEAFGDVNYLKEACSIGQFIASDLNRSFESNDEICFSYTPLDKSIIFNASLLAGETLAFVGALDNNNEWLKLAEKTARFVLRRQNARGTWEYGTKLRHQWVDNFHTAFILSSLSRMKPFLPELNNEIESAVKKGYDFWIENLFLVDGTPKYYQTKTFPIDIHSAAAAIVALCDLREMSSDDGSTASSLRLAEKVAVWTIANLRDKSGFFYYQKTRFQIIKTPFIRWAQAWMLYALARLLEESKENDSSFDLSVRVI